MSTQEPHPLSKYIRKGAQPQTHCSGCGNGMIAQSFLRAVDDLGIPKEKIVCVAGIGCSGWIPSPLFDMDTLHVTHGRPIAFATGVKLGNPNLEVVVFTGDGDASAIGGNHLIHAARRNIGLKVICVNNMIYGMTGGEVAPTTPQGLKTTTTPFGNLERPFDLSRLVIGAGGTY
ncbi:2-oxoglutarate synthase, partial [bacterium]